MCYAGAKTEVPLFTSPVRPSGFGGRGLDRVPEEIMTRSRDSSLSSKASSDSNDIMEEASLRGQRAAAHADEDEESTPARMEMPAPDYQQFLQFQEWQQRQQQQFHVRHSGLSVSSSTTRGTEDREAKRKAPQVSPTFASGIPASNLASFASVAHGAHPLATVESAGTEEEGSKKEK